MPTISSLVARQILDSRGNPTIEVDCFLDDGSMGRAAVPSGASTGSHEALELRDGVKNIYDGKSVHNAVAHVHTSIFPALQGMDVSDQRAIDMAMVVLDGTEHKSSLGANAILGVSMAVCRARAVSLQKPLWEDIATQFGVKNATLLPTPMMNVLNGGKHADNGLAVQECMIIPWDFDCFSDALRAGAEIFHTLKSILSEKGMTTSVGDEGGFAPHLRTVGEACDLLMEAIDVAGYTGKIRLALDAAASEFCEDGQYTIDGRALSSDALKEYYVDLLKAYPIVSLEDAFHEDDWNGFSSLMDAVGDKVQLVGDDLLVTDVKRMEIGRAKNAANAVLVKVNQIGSVSEAADAILTAQEWGWQSVVSHRSGETEDSFIADFAVGLRSGQIKTGSLSRTDRVCKYNQLLRIEEQLGEKARYGA